MRCCLMGLYCASSPSLRRRRSRTARRIQATGPVHLHRYSRRRRHPQMVVPPVPARTQATARGDTPRASGHDRRLLPFGAALSEALAT